MQLNQPRQSAMQRCSTIDLPIADNMQWLQSIDCSQPAKLASLDKDGWLAKATFDGCQSHANDMGWWIYKVSSIIKWLYHQGCCKVVRWSYSNQWEGAYSTYGYLVPVGPSSKVQEWCKTNAAVSMTRILGRILLKLRRRWQEMEGLYYRKEYYKYGGK